MRIKAGNKLSEDANVLDFGTGFTLTEVDKHVAVSNGGSRPFVGTADPSLTLTAGTEYVWFQTDGSGNLIDLWTGVV